jgi:hypothetical protein
LSSINGVEVIGFIPAGALVGYSMACWIPSDALLEPRRLRADLQRLRVA